MTLSGAQILNLSETLMARAILHHIQVEFLSSNFTAKSIQGPLYKNVAQAIYFWVTLIMRSESSQNKLLGVQECFC